MNKTNILLIILIVVVICVGTGVCLTNMNKEKTVVVNKTVNNTTNNTVKHINSDDTKASDTSQQGDNSQKNNALKSPEEQYKDILTDNGEKGKAANGYVYYEDGSYEHFVNDVVVDGNHYGSKI